MRKAVLAPCLVLLLQLGPHPAICSPSLPSFVHPARVDALRSRTGRPFAADGCEHKTRLEATRAHRLVRFLRGIELPAFGETRRLREMAYAANKRRARKCINNTIDNGELNSSGTFMAILNCALEDVGLPRANSRRGRIKALAEIYASRPFRRYEVSARALERIWQQCCKDGRGFEQFYLDMWSEIDNGNYAHVQRCYGDPLWIDLEDESNLDAMHEMAKELGVQAISDNRLGVWEFAEEEEEPDPYELYCDVKGDKETRQTTTPKHAGGAGES
ncbi:unnamed protein product [Vitrella brassicaformis CCMP3155]|uniref:Uncharacterized protein n=1 Tax=Vitrella brassicaformis (strain CCMP3155) TaxID=1169540 RepID=A0A0G4EKH0_VITBC|nr:unnamed protein product [Vitrella brassicaformis CCMP3155]|eukprot:CEL97055.1 unnamed protein product [Vitrella brassicaformis CCMP3155]